MLFITGIEHASLFLIQTLNYIDELSPLMEVFIKGEEIADCECFHYGKTEGVHETPQFIRVRC